MFCVMCGNELMSGSKFCAHCGAKVMSTNQATSGNESVDKTKVDSSLVDFFTQLQRLEEKRKVFVGEGIPSKKLQNAIEEYAHAVDPQSVLLLLDDTVFGSAKDGLLITSDGLYSHQMGMKPQFVPFDTLSAIEITKQKFGSELMVNGIKLMTVCTAENNLSGIAKAIEVYAKALKSAPVHMPTDNLHEASQNLTLRSEESNVISQEVKDIFFALEDSLAEKSVLFGVAPESMISSSLTPEFYDDDGVKKMKCTITIECTQDECVDDDTLEAISDTVSDYFSDSEYKEDLSQLGYEDMPDWWPVEFSNVAEQGGATMFSDLIDRIIDSYKADPRNNVHIDEATLLAAAIEETGNDISVTELRKAITRFITGEMDDDDQTTYDGAVYACSVAANNCFGDDPDADVDYEIEWLENSDGSFTAEVRPT